MQVYFYQEGGVPVHLLRKGETVDHPLFDWAVARRGFEAKAEEVCYVPSSEGSVIFAGLGDQEPLELESMRRLFFRVGTVLKENHETEIEVHMPMGGVCQRKLFSAAYEGLVQSRYLFSKKTIDRPEEADAWTLNYFPAKPGKEALFQKILGRIQNIMDGVFLARDLVNETANIMTPTELAKRAKEMLEPAGVQVEVLEEEQIRALGMEAYLAVAQGSAEPPKLIVMSYTGAPDSKEKTALVGKGLTYDSGGLNVKTPDGMLHMHADMGGAGTVIGTMRALALEKPAVNVVAVVAAAENMSAGNAYKAGDIIGSRAGKTIEVINTDAEGRLTLADAVHYATTDLGATRIVDLATLTGAVLMALGEETTGAVTNDPALFSQIEEAATIAGEPVWLFPRSAYYEKLNQSTVADLKNSGGRMAGSVSAGLFVGAFVANETPWVHLDIAGTAYRSKAEGYLPERASGVHVKTLVEWLSPMGGCHD